MGATDAPDWLCLEPGARSWGEETPVGLDVLVRLWVPTALSKTLLVGPEPCGLPLPWGRGLLSAGAELGSVAEAGVPELGGTRPRLSYVRGEWPRILDGPLVTGAPGRTLPFSST